MMGHTHLAFGLLAGLLALPFAEPRNAVLFVLLAALASLFPDIDHESSTINRLLPVTRWFAKLFTHRGFFHSVWPALLLYGLFWYLALPDAGLALALGYLSHLLSDSVTKMGVNLLHPVATLRVQGFITTGGVLELAVLAFILLAVAWKVWRMVG